MLMSDLPDNDTIEDPAPNFPTAAEIELADELRLRLEQRYLDPPVRFSYFRASRSADML